MNDKDHYFVVMLIMYINYGVFLFLSTYVLTYSKFYNLQYVSLFVYFHYIPFDKSKLILARIKVLNSHLRLLTVQQRQANNENRSRGH